ncbi:hypothetical protein G6M50_06395 [Agrobacterium rhizogenes]|nr:hypothetical protein [Rhizobium rhizogenes]NTJ77433.1 hypothetical protein [Rhizobium rhizogenes]
MSYEPIYPDASTEPLEIIRSNECEYHIGSLSTSRFQALWNEIERLRSERQYQAEVMEEVRKVLEPFAKAGKIIDGPFGPALFAEDDMAFKSGCAWSENGVSRTITWGDFRAARALLSKLGVE